MAEAFGHLQPPAARQNAFGSENERRWISTLRQKKAKMGNRLLFRLWV
jgi:hypothetical protein